MCSTSFILNFKYDVVAKAESLGVFTKTIVLYVFAVQLSYPALLAFAISQIVYSLILFVYQYAALYKTLGHLDTLYPTKLAGEQYILEDMKSMGYQFTLMAFMKFILQELEKIVIVSFQADNPMVSGEFSLVSHLGAMVPRFIYAPLEEVSFNYFSKMSSEKEYNESYNQEMSYLQKVLKFLNLIGIAMVCGGIPLSKSVLVSMYGSQWGVETCVTAMQIFCVYEWIMGINGILEAFVNATLKEKQMNRYRGYLVAQTAVYMYSSSCKVYWQSAVSPARLPWLQRRHPRQLPLHGLQDRHILLHHQPECVRQPMEAAACQVPGNPACELRDRRVRGGVLADELRVP